MLLAKAAILILLKCRELIVLNTCCVFMGKKHKQVLSPAVLGSTQEWIELTPSGHYYTTAGADRQPIKTDRVGSLVSASQRTCEKDGGVRGFELCCA